MLLNWRRSFNLNLRGAANIITTWLAFSHSLLHWRYLLSCPFITVSAHLPPHNRSSGKQSLISAVTFFQCWGQSLPCKRQAKCMLKEGMCGCAWYPQHLCSVGNATEYCIIKVHSSMSVLTPCLTVGPQTEAHLGESIDFSFHVNNWDVSLDFLSMLSHLRWHQMTMKTPCPGTAESVTPLKWPPPPLSSLEPIRWLNFYRTLGGWLVPRW